MWSTWIQNSIASSTQTTSGTACREEDTTHAISKFSFQVVGASFGGWGVGFNWIMVYTHSYVLVMALWIFLHLFHLVSLSYNRHICKREAQI